MKKNKAGGPGGVRAEVLQKIVEDDECTEILVGAMNRICEEGEIPTSWKTSNTTMIKKVNKPKKKDFRPIAVTSVGSKLYWGFLRDNMEEHLVRWGMVWDNQTGFTKGGRPE